jgi:hypothetical protein
MRGKLLVAVLCALLLLPAALALSAGGGPGVGGCKPDVDNDYRGLCVHTRHLVINRTKTIHPRHFTTVTATATHSAVVTAAGGTTTVPGTTTTTTSTVPGGTVTVTSTSTSLVSGTLVTVTTTVTETTTTTASLLAF